MAHRGFAGRMGLVAVAALVVAAVEITILVLVAQTVGVAPTLLLVLATTALGVLLVRREGARAWRALQSTLVPGPASTAPLGDGAVGLVAGGLLVVPGFLTDVAGLVLLVPPVRRLVMAGAGRLAGRRLSTVDPSVPRRVRVRTGPVDRPAADAGQPLEGEVLDAYPPRR